MERERERKREREGGANEGGSMGDVPGCKVVVLRGG